MIARDRNRRSGWHGRLVRPCGAQHWQTSCQCHPVRRSGFTLLEVLLASAIAVMLLGALYVAFDLTLRQTDAGREAVSQGDLGRAIVNRMTIDLAGCLGPMPPKSGGGTGSSTSSATTGTTTSSTTPSTTTTSSSSSSSSTTGSTTESGTESGTTSDTGTEGQAAADVPFQGGLFGGPQQLTLFVSRVPPTLANRETIAAGTDQPPSDLLRVTYYLSATGRGLCRQVRPWVTADGVRNATDPDRSTEDADLLAEEVTDVTFEYFDGSTWAGEWDGSLTQTDGKTVQGPPRAIRVTMTIQPPGGTATKQIQHVFPVRAAVGLYQPPVEETPATTTTTGGM